MYTHIETCDGQCPIRDDYIFYEHVNSVYRERNGVHENMFLKPAFISCEKVLNTYFLVPLSEMLIYYSYHYACSTKEMFLQDLLVILKQMLQNN